VYDTTNGVLLVNLNSDNLITTADFRIALSAASTASATVVEGDINFVITAGSGSDTITAGSGADTIVGGGGADYIVSGAGNDSVTVVAAGADTVFGGSGGDTIALGGGTAVDYVAYSQALGADGGITTATADAVSGFVAASDLIGVTGALKTAIDLTGANAVTGATTSSANNGNVATAANTELLFSVTANSALAAADFGTMASVATALNAMFDFTTAPTGPVLALIASSGGATSHALYLYTEAGTSTGNNAVDAGEVRLLGVFTTDAALAAANVVYF
jgi:hypothetical protein